jgi:hypothetical protein
MIRKLLIFAFLVWMPVTYAGVDLTKVGNSTSITDDGSTITLPLNTVIGSTALGANLTVWGGITSTGEINTADSVVASKGLMFNGIIRSMGGNARGTYAVDLQTYRGTATQVASGSYSTIIGGNTNAATGWGSAALGGEGNVSSGTNSATISGSGNTASGAYSTASGIYAIADLYGEKANSSGRFAAAADAQFSDVMLRDTTSTLVNAVADTLKLNGVDNSILGKLIIPINTSYYFEGEVIGRVISANFFNQAAAYKIEGGVSRNATTTTTLDWSAATMKFEGANLGACACTVAVNDTDDQLAVLVTGVASTTIRWVCHLRLVKVSGATL